MLSLGSRNPTPSSIALETDNPSLRPAQNPLPIPDPATHYPDPYPFRSVDPPPSPRCERTPSAHAESGSKPAGWGDGPPRPDRTHRRRRPPHRHPPSCWRRRAPGARGRHCKPSAGRATSEAPSPGAGAPGTHRSAPAAPEPRHRPPRVTTPRPRPRPQTRPTRRRHAFRRQPSPRLGLGCRRRPPPPPPPRRPPPPRPPFTRRRGRPGGRRGAGLAAQAQTHWPPTAGPPPPRGRAPPRAAWATARRARGALEAPRAAAC